MIIGRIEESIESNLVKALGPSSKLFCCSDGGSLAVSFLIFSSFLVSFGVFGL